MRHHTSKVVTLLLGLTLVGSMAACGSSDETPGTGSSDNGTSTTTTNAGDPQTGGVLKIGTSLAMPQLGYTPEMSGNATIPFAQMTFQSLTFYDEAGQIAPLLAESWETDPENLTITYHLREGVQFSDGTDFNAEAVKWNIEQYKESGRSEVAVVDSIDTPDEHTAILNLTQWNSSTLEAVGFFVYYMSPTAFEENGGIEGTRTNPVGTGPFLLSAVTETVSATYTKNTNYWEEGKPYLDGVEIYTMTEATTLNSSLQAGDFNMITNTSVDQLRQLGDASGFTTVGNTNGTGLESVGLIPSSADESDPFYSADVRKAVCYALDKDTLLEALGFGYLKPLNQWAAPGASTYNPDVVGQPYDPAKAKELLAAAGYADGFDTTVYATAANANWATAIADQLTAVGIRASVETVDNNQLFAQMSDGWSGLTWHFASISPDLGLYMGRHLDPNGAFYASGIQHPEDALELLEAIRTATDDTVKQEKSWELQSLIYDDLALFGCPLYINQTYVVKDAKVQGDNWAVNHSVAWTPQNAWLQS